MQTAWSPRTFLDLSSLLARCIMHLLNKGVRAMGLKSLNNLVCPVLGTEIMIAILLGLGTKLVLMCVLNSLPGIFMGVESVDD